MPELRAREVVRALRALGFELDRQAGAHAIYVHASGGIVPVPIHPTKRIRTPLLYEIAREAGIPIVEFIALARGRRR